MHDNVCTCCRLYPATEGLANTRLRPALQQHPDQKPAARPQTICNCTPHCDIQKPAARPQTICNCTPHCDIQKPAARPQTICNCTPHCDIQKIVCILIRSQTDTRTGFVYAVFFFLLTSILFLMAFLTEKGVQILGRNSCLNRPDCWMFPDLNKSVTLITPNYC